jgi:hypothetical protein
VECSAIPASTSFGPQRDPRADPLVPDRHRPGTIFDIIEHRSGKYERSKQTCQDLGLAGRPGPRAEETVAELSRLVIAKAQRETRFRARAVRIDSTVVEADVRYPTDAGLAGDGVRTLAREGKRLRGKLGATTTTVRDRSRAVGKRLRAIARTLRRRTGEAKCGARADGANEDAARRLGAGGAACGRRGAYEGAGAGPLAEGVELPRFR